jgi:hypothetical protein
LVRTCFIALLVLWPLQLRADDMHGSKPLNTLEDMRVELQRCYQPTAISQGQQVTIRFAFKADGRLLGVPRVTYVGGAANPTMRKVLAEGALKAIAACTPLALTKGLAGAIAGRVYTMRFVGRHVLPLS